MELQRLVTGAKLGRSEDFGALVRLYQHRLLATVLTLVRDRHEAEDLVQEAFVRAWSRLGTLRHAEAFPTWLWAIARNLARTQGRVLARDGQRRDPSEPDDLADPRSAFDAGELSGGWTAVAGSLTADQRLLVDLRHGAGLSLRQIGAVLGVPEQRVKSRLFAVRRKLERALGQRLPASPPTFLEEKIMDKIATLRLGAHVIERLSLAAQASFALAVLAEKSLDEALLAEIGRVDRGAEFLALYGTTLQLGELVGLMNYIDRFTEGRLIEHLEVVAPPEAERLKQNFFVFEDILCFDPPALRLLSQTADPNLLVQALGGTERRVQLHFLAVLDPPERTDWEARLGKVDGDRKLVRAAQELVVHGIKTLEQAGRLVLCRRGDVPDGEIIITAPEH